MKAIYFRMRLYVVSTYHHHYHHVDFCRLDQYKEQAYLPEEIKQEKEKLAVER